jgi:post-segregation antitoxin (ccd killing protein)
MNSFVKASKQVLPRKKSSESTRRKKTAAPTVARRTITLPPSLNAQIEATVGPRNFSAFAQRALVHELQRETIAEWLDEREAARRGKSLSPAALDFAEQAWAQRK